MTTPSSSSGGAGKRPGRSPEGKRAEQDRKDRLAEQLRANLAKRKQQQRKRETGETSGGDE